MKPEEPAQPVEVILTNRRKTGTPIMQEINPDDCIERAIKWPTLELHRRVRSRSYLTNQQREHGKGSREIYPNKVRRNGPDRGYCHRSRARINPVPLALTRLLPPLLSNFRFFLGFRLQRQNTEVNQRQRNRDKRVFQSQNSKTGKLKLWNAALIAGVS